MTRSHKLRFTPAHLHTYTYTYVRSSLCGRSEAWGRRAGSAGRGGRSPPRCRPLAPTHLLTKHVASPPPVLPACSSHLSFPFQYVNGGGREGYLPVDIASLMAWHRLDPPSCQPMSGKSVIFHSKQVRRKKKEKTIMSILVPWYTLYFIHTQHL